MERSFSDERQRFFHTAIARLALRSGGRRRLPGSRDFVFVALIKQLPPPRDPGFGSRPFQGMLNESFTCSLEERKRKSYA
jgi:hypothetical protein